MLKISLIENRTRCRLVLEGKLIVPWTAEVRTAWANARADLNGRRLVVDMKHVTGISHEGENLLLELMNEGANFRCCGPFTKQVLKQLSRRAAKGIRQANE